MSDYDIDSIDELTYTPKHHARLNGAIQSKRFFAYASQSRPTLVNRLSYIVGQLQELVADIALVECSAAHVRIHTYYQSEQKSVQGRDRDASFYANQFVNELTELRATRDIYLIEKEFILLLLGSAASDNPAS